MNDSTMKTLLFYPLAKDVVDTKDENGNDIQISEYTIPDGVETIRTKAFYKCGKIAKLIIPDSVKNIEEKAFYDILNIVARKYEFEYPDDKMIELSKRIKLIVDEGRDAPVETTSLLEK